MTTVNPLPEATKTISTTSAVPKPSLIETYYVAHRARGKLSREAARKSHDLRQMVGHANMLDSLMLVLDEAEPSAS